MTANCQYDELIRFKSNGYFLCAAKKGNKWAILDWYTNKLLTDYNYNRFENLSLPYGTKSEYYNY